MARFVHIGRFAINIDRITRITFSKGGPETAEVAFGSKNIVRLVEEDAVALRRAMEEPRTPTEAEISRRGLAAIADSLNEFSQTIKSHDAKADVRVDKLLEQQAELHADQERLRERLGVKGEESLWQKLTK